MAASGDNFIFEVFLDGCFSKTAAKISFRNSRLHMYYISYRDVMSKRNEFLYFLSEGFGEKCKHTELVLNFIENNILVKKKTYFTFIILK